MIQFLVDNPLLLLFLVAGVGYPLGRLQVRGVSLGVAAVLFSGLAFGALDPRLKLPEIVYVLGLALFVYAVGLSSGPAFVASLRRDGARANFLALGAIAAAAALVAWAGRLLGLKATLVAGLYAGSLTNTPALAGALETVKHLAAGPALERMLAEPVVGYSIAYPMGVIGMVLAIALAQRVWRTDYAQEARSLRGFGLSNEPLGNVTIRVTRPEATRGALGETARERGWDVIFGRIKRGEHFLLADPAARLQADDLVIAVGTSEELARVIADLGEPAPERIDLDRREFDQRRIFVSESAAAGRPIESLELRAQFGAVITRVRRGDAELLPQPGMVLELGDRVRVVAPTDRMAEVSAFLGDSYQDVSELDLFTVSLGLALGLLVGVVPIPLPGGVKVNLGFAGGPLLVALALGVKGRVGQLVFSLPYAANRMLRQMGLVLFLAGVGTRAGFSFRSTFVSSGGLLLFAAGAAVTVATAALVLWVGHRLLGVPMSLLIGMLAGIQTQPAVLGYALEQTGNELPNIGYTAVYPVATLAKILVVQVLLLALS
ncbi:MAG TPA: aspartate:alanine exchanger family transporter [Anaeromyxobacteraceae bacterium]|nr:aspartate:alanine exchanger family transporter [Anaeromyxobacteraceae bacterium]